MFIVVLSSVIERSTIESVPSTLVQSSSLKFNGSQIYCQTNPEPPQSKVSAS